MNEPPETLLLPRGLILLASGWLVASWLMSIGVRAPVESSSASYVPGVRVMLICMAIGLVVAWPLLRLSEPATEFPLRRAILDLVVLISLMQVVLWPLRLVTPWTPTRTAAIDATLIAWTLLAGAVVAAASGSRSAAIRCGAVAACLIMCLGGPVLAWLGVVGGMMDGAATSIWGVGPLAETHRLASVGSSPPTAAQWQWIVMAAGAALCAWLGLAIAVACTRPAAITERLEAA